MRFNGLHGLRAASALATIALIVASITIAHALPGAAEPEVDSTAPTSPDEAVDMTDRSAIPSITWKMADDVPVWKAIRLGTFTNVNTLREALESDDCGLAQGVMAERPSFVRASVTVSRALPHCRLGETANEIIGRPAFHLSRIKQDVDLLLVSLTDLGFAPDEKIALEDIYARAELLNYTLCPAEVGAQLRLQYRDQPVDEFLHVAMEPINTFAGVPTDLTVGNGGAGLLLIGGNAQPNVTLPANTRFVFVRRRPLSPQ